MMYTVDKCTHSNGKNLDMTTYQINRHITRAFLDAMADRHVARFDSVLLDAVEKCMENEDLKKVINNDDEFYDIVLELCMQANIEDLTKGQLMIERWGVISNCSHTPVLMIRDMLKPRPDNDNKKKQRGNFHMATGAPTGIATVTRIY